MRALVARAVPWQAPAMPTLHHALTHSLRRPLSLGGALIGLILACGTVARAGDHPQSRAVVDAGAGVTTVDMAVSLEWTAPWMDGATTIKQLNTKDPTLRFVAISGLMKGDKFEEEIGLKDVSFLVKPFNAEKLLMVLRRVLSGQTDVIRNLKMADAISGGPRQLKIAMPV